MNYPTWLLDIYGGGTIIALVAVAHVYISHLAVGGGLFLVLTEMKGLRQGSREILSYVKVHSKFFLLLTMVFGGMSGVGIWFTIALIHPTATSSLIHIFVFGWAAEWVFFFCEILSLFLYYYTFDRLDSGKHLTLGWIYFGCAWMSLFLINGIIDFMLTPGAWLENRNFWSGFFNPTFWPALFFRTFFALMIAGLFGFITSANIKNKALREEMVRYCALWLLPALLLLVASGFWYKVALPPPQAEMIFATSPEMARYVRGFIIISPLLFAGGLLIAMARPSFLIRPLAWLLVILGFGYMGCFEMIREGGRRPFIIHDYMYSNGILKEELGEFREEGVLEKARWVTDEERAAKSPEVAGRKLSTLLCLPCHSQGGFLNDIKPLVQSFTREGMASYLAGLGRVNSYMPPFPGTPQERDLLSGYLTTVLTQSRESQPQISPEELAIPRFAPEDKYLLVAASDRGAILTSEPQLSGLDFSFAPPRIKAQLIQRAESPTVTSDRVEISYRVIGKPEGEGGRLKAAAGYFQAELADLTPAAKPFRPYRLINLEAKVAGKLVAKTKVRVGLSNGFACRNCHGGPWRSEGSGLSRQTAENILTAHDKRSHTKLAREHEQGKIVVCSSCHSDSSRGAKGDASLLTLSGAVHGFHGAILGTGDENNCHLCHPVGSDSQSQSFDGLHGTTIGLNCSDCHGGLASHGAAILKAESSPGAKPLLAKLAGRTALPVEEIRSRRPWEMEPDCLSCHPGFAPPEKFSGFNQWTNGKQGLFGQRMGEGAVLLCLSCHGSPHGLYPARSPHSREVGVIQPLQYQQKPYPMGADKGCAVCHTKAMADELHHPGMLQEFRNRL
ncbi:MAG: cytochrome ubiquinol oxidase subunit I [Thermodesulfobacteriota bacterium]